MQAPEISWSNAPGSNGYVVPRPFPQFADVHCHTGSGWVGVITRGLDDGVLLWTNARTLSCKFDIA